MVVGEEWPRASVERSSLINVLPQGIGSKTTSTMPRHERQSCGNGVVMTNLGNLEDR